MPNKATSQEDELNKSHQSQDTSMDFIDASDFQMDVFSDEKEPRFSRFALKLVLVYFGVASLFAILFSETVLVSVFGVPTSALSWINPCKIWLLIIAGSVLFYFLISHRTYLMLLEQRELDASLKRMERLNQIHQLISQTNHAILRIRDKEQLLKDICQILKDVGQFSYVWIGISESAEAQPNMMVTSGKEDDYLRMLFEGLQNASATERGEPALSALRKKYAVVVNDVAGFSKNAFAWQTRALKFNFQSIAGFPFKTAAGFNGVIALYANVPNYFSTEETTLLRALAADVSYGISEIEHKTQLYYAANYDVVTHLPNRQLFEDRLNQAMSRALHDKRVVGVVIVEIADLAKTTESLGQAVGDKLLQETGNHLMRLVRDGDTVARIAHNQLGIMLADAAEALDVALVAQKLIRPFAVHLSKQNEIQIHLRAGVAIYPQDGDTPSTLIQNATVTLHEMIIERQSECSFYSKQVSSGIKYSQQIKQSLTTALERNEFNLYYQPIVQIKDRKMIGVEALARWRNAGLGDVSPVQFIAEAEASGLIIPLGEWILKTACLQSMQWRQMGQHDLMMTVNLSVKQITHPKFVESIEHLFRKISFDPSTYHLAFEIPETALLDELKYTLEVLLALRELGVKIIIDDFGTGYSSLSYLHQLPVDILKIDPMFIRNIGKDQNTKALIRGILAFATGLEVKSIAEGVETDKQAEILTELGCDYMQGYLYSAPVAAKNLESFFGKHF
ncbi:MAG: EAL domain-containing protein [Candidatus Berkiella sp.]